MIIIEKMIRLVEEYLPTIINEDIIGAKKMAGYIQKYQDSIKSKRDRNAEEPLSIFDYIAIANKGDKKALALLQYFDKAVGKLLYLYPQFEKNIIKRIKEVFAHNQKNPSFLEPLGELLMLCHLANTNSELIALDFEIGNGKNIDYAFRDGDEITLIEVKNIHNLLRKGGNVYELIKNDVVKKIKDKTQRIDLCQKFFLEKYGEVKVGLYVLFFSWHEYYDLNNYKDDILRIQKEFKDDMMPICSLFPQKQNDGSFIYNITNIVGIIEMRNEDIIKERSEPWQLGIAKHITFIVTKDCQLACKYCYLVGKNEKERMSWNTAKAAIDYILGHEADFPEASVVWDFIGGEPFLEIELIDKICDYLKMEMFRLKHHWFDSYRFSFSTNGINYHSDKVQQFIKKNHSHLSIGITIDGTRAKHDLNRIYKGDGPVEKGSYDDVVRNIPLWLEQFPNGGTKVTISSADIPYIKESVLHLYSLGIHEVNINCVFEDVWQEGDDKRFEDQLMQLADAIIYGGYYQEYACSFFSENIGKPLDPELENQNWCGAGKMLAVDAAGMFYPCTRFAAYSLREKCPIIIGNVRDGIDKNKLRPFLTLDRTTQSPQKCLECEVASGCAWCQGENYDAADTNTVYQRSTAICLMHKARVRANNYYWNKLFRKLELEGEREQFESNKPKLNEQIC